MTLVADHSFFCVLSALGEAVAAIDRPVSPGLERHLRGFTATGAYRVKHFAGRAPAAVTTFALAGDAAALAADGLVRKAFLGKKFLLAGGKNKIFTAVSAF
jgi:hypothetical protein